MKKNAVVGQSGGPTAVINASLYGTVYEALNREDEIGTVYGMINGIEGSGPHPAHILAPADTSFRKISTIRFIHSFLHASKHTTSDISSTSEAMIPWILSASFPAMPKRSAATSV